MNNPVLPHRYPFLFIDRVEESEPGKWVKGYKFITENQKEMPFSIIIEALAQTAAFTALKDPAEIGFLSSVKNAECIGKAVVGDKLDLYFEVSRYKRGFLFGTGTASVNGKPAAKAEIGIFMEAK
ncbi:beta-hydroxyacyl-ACP dehydratase [Bacillus haynesii]|uniref:3-hydroxyacyl-ACP dehydratase FabZ family protein n=1 Tax=Bacillus haynesii TaxID=1925021 RepID=UPI002DB98DF6|nr:3-hydroxyacyl-ACP dehydratase FabZ family protein [Bacillus haynesii]MEC1474646.1 beta-hydroxyacyl-ACP dehydratase [Bacillus haynesii]MEC1485929.1 beta-hydroxyacyl-ACP dehydratase [Bacillus haynesii]